jgi:hypothetical protein
MNRRGFFATLLAPALAKILPKPKQTYTTPWIGMDLAATESKTIIEIWYRDPKTGEMVHWPQQPSPYWHGREPFIMVDLSDQQIAKWKQTT